MIWVAALFLSACGFDPDPYHALVPDEVVYSYEFAEAGCSTGRRVFLDKARYCQALADDSLNGRCASGKRFALLAQHC